MVAGLVSAAMLRAGARRGCGAGARGVCPTQGRRGCLGRGGGPGGLGQPGAAFAVSEGQSAKEEPFWPLQGPLGRRW